MLVFLGIIIVFIGVIVPGFEAIIIMLIGFSLLFLAMLTASEEKETKEESLIVRRYLSVEEYSQQAENLLKKIINYLAKKQWDQIKPYVCADFFLINNLGCLPSSLLYIMNLTCIRIEKDIIEFRMQSVSSNYHNCVDDFQFFIDYNNNLLLRKIIKGSL